MHTHAYVHVSEDIPSLCVCNLLQAYCLEELGQHLESRYRESLLSCALIGYFYASPCMCLHRYSTAGYIIWYNSSEDTPSHPKHDELITNSLTCLPNSKIKGQSQHGMISPPHPPPNYKQVTSSQ